MSYDIECAYFETEKNNLEDIAQIDMNNITALKKGDIIKIHEIDERNLLYCIELSNGKKYIITTQVAG